MLPNISTTKAKLFTIRYSINQAIGIPHIKCIFVITDLLHTAKKIFDLSLYSYQIHSAVISHELRDFFNKDIDNCIEFWNCPSNENWCCGNHQTQCPMISLTSKSQSWISSGEFTRELNKESLLN